MIDRSEIQRLEARLAQLEQELARYRGQGGAGGGQYGAGGAQGGAGGAAAGASQSPMEAAWLVANALKQILPPAGPMSLMQQGAAGAQAAGCGNTQGDTVAWCCSRFACVTVQCTTGGWC